MPRQSSCRESCCRRDDAPQADIAESLARVAAASSDIAVLIPTIVEEAMRVTGAPSSAVRIAGSSDIPNFLALGALAGDVARLHRRFDTLVDRCIAQGKICRARIVAGSSGRPARLVAAPLALGRCDLNGALIVLTHEDAAPPAPLERALSEFAAVAGALLSRSAERETLGRRLAEHRDAFDRVHERDVLFRAALRAAHEGVVIRDAAGAVKAANDSATRILGFAPADLFEFGPAASQWTLVREDRSECPLSELPDCVAMTTREPVADQVVGIERSDGRVTWLLVSACPLISERDPQPYGAVMTFYDISERKAAFDASARLAAIVDSSQDAILAATLDGTIVSWNRGAERLFGYCADEMLGRGSSVLSPSNDPTSFKATIKRLLRGERIDVDECVRFRKDGVPVHVSMTYSLIRNAAGAAVGLAAIARDVSDRVRYEEQIRSQMRQINEINAELQSQKAQLELANVKLEELAAIDSLTGLKNRRVFTESLQHEIDGASRYSTALSIFMLDVDDFKDYNDRFGHPAGDEVLRRIAQILQHNCRRADIVARYGGEEFVVILPQTPAEGARIIAERCRVMIERSVWPQRPVTASFGVSTLNALLDSSAAIVSAADRALYYSKSRGRNCVSHVFDMHSFTPQSSPAA